jgi:hypothetical protein
MPYIKQEKRRELDGLLKDLADRVDEEGELNYCFYKLSTEIIARIGESYSKLGMCSAAMEHAKLEWYRRRLSPYEDKKIRENGDI